MGRQSDRKPFEQGGQMKTRKMVAAVIMILLPIIGLCAQNPSVIVRLHTPPPGQLQYEDLWWVDLTNTTDRPLTVHLHGLVTEAQHGRIFEANTDDFLLPAIQRRTIRARDIGQLHDVFYAPGYEVFVRRTGSLPEGQYTYTISVEPGDLGSASGGANVGRPGAPRLISPPDGATLRELPIIFTWSGPFRRPSGQPLLQITYALKIVEVLPGQSKDEAMQANRPWFVQGGLTATSFRYPTSARRFEKGRNYAWQVLAMNGRTVLAMSEIWGFRSELEMIGPIPGGIDLYLADGGEAAGSVYHYNGSTESAIFTRPSNRLYSFLFAPWDTTMLYFVNANEYKIYVKDLASASPETVAYTHSTYVRDIEVGKDGAIYFSEATGGGGDGKIWKLTGGGSASPYYTVRLSTVDGYWSGDFTFDPAGMLYLSNGNRVGASIYRVDVAGGTVTKVYSDPNAIGGMMFGTDGLLYYADCAKSIFALDLTTSSKSLVYQNAARTSLSDVRFKPSSSPVVAPPGATTWVLPWSVGDFRIDNIKPSGLIDYTDGASGLYMTDAPFGGGLSLSHSCSWNVPSPAIKYYRWEYNCYSTGWNELTTPIYAYYVIDIPYNPPVIMPFQLGPFSVAGKQLYLFWPDTSALPHPPGSKAYWFANVHASGNYSGSFSSGAPADYRIRLTCYDPTGTQVLPGMGTFRFVVPNGTGGGGSILTRYANPSEIDAGGYWFKIHVDNRPCSAFVYVPHMDTTTVADECGMMRYDTTDTNPVMISYHASHPANFALHSFFIVRGINTVTGSTVSGAEVTANPAGLYVRDSGSNFTHGFTLADLFGPKCTEAAFSENLYLFAKATTGNGYRITSYDRSSVRAFAMAKKQ
jgi:hypothetical protein